MVSLNISDVTVGSGTLTGDGAFDVFMQAAMAHLKREYSEGRITGDKYAEAYIAIMNNVLNTASQFAVNRVNVANQSELTQEQKNLIIAQTKVQQAQISDTVDGKTVTGSVGKQKEVYAAQIEGFATDALQKATKLIVDTWSVRESATDAGTGATAENKLVDTNVGKMVGALASKVNVTLT